MHVVFAGRLVCSVNMLYMELSYTGSLDQSTRASEHVTVQISCACKTTAGYHTFLKFIYLIKLHCNECILFIMLVVFVTGLFCEHALYGTKLHWFIELVD